MPLAERFVAIRDWEGDTNDRYGAFVQEYLLRFSHYVLTTGPVVARDIPSIDDAMAWGYAWEAGPFAQMDLLGAEFLAKGFSRLSLDEPELLRPSEGRVLRRRRSDRPVVQGGLRADRAAGG